MIVNEFIINKRINKKDVSRPPVPGSWTMGHYYLAEQHFLPMPGHVHRRLLQAWRIQLWIILARMGPMHLLRLALRMVLGYLARLQDLRKQQAPQHHWHARHRPVQPTRTTPDVCRSTPDLRSTLSTRKFAKGLQLLIFASNSALNQKHYILRGFGVLGFWGFVVHASPTLVKSFYKFSFTKRHLWLFFILK